MIYASPGSDFEAILDSAPTGLVGTLTIQIENADGTTHTAPTTNGIVEVEPGVYSAALTAPSGRGTYVVVWNDGSHRPAEDLRVTYTTPAGPVDPLTEVGQIRLLISDVGGDDGESFIFNEDEVQAFLNLEPSHLYRAAALALRTLASNEALVQKRIKYLELETDGPATAKALLEAAKGLEERADKAEDDDVLPAFASMGGDFTSRDQRLGTSADIVDEVE